MPAVWWMLGTMIAFKVGLTLFILIAYPSVQNLIAQVALNALWFVGIVVLLASPAIFWWRMLRLRARRKQLQWAEWHVD
jgi:hypothetical protein